MGSRPEAIRIIVIDGCGGQETSRYENADISETIMSTINPTCASVMQIEVIFLKGACAEDLRRPQSQDRRVIHRHVASDPALRFLELPKHTLEHDLSGCPLGELKFHQSVHHLPRFR